jgi:hypothetical protein
VSSDQQRRDRFIAGLAVIAAVAAAAFVVFF